MKVCIFPNFNFKVDKGEGGIKQVALAQHKHFPSLGIEIVNSPEQADIVAVHADMIRTDKPVAYHCHGLYYDSLWSGKLNWPDWALIANKRIIQEMNQASIVSVPSRYVHNYIARGMCLDTSVLMHGVDIENWEPADNFGYVTWLKNRPDEVCRPQDVNALAELCPDLRFVSTFGEATNNVSVTGRMTHERTKNILKNAGVYLATTKETGGITVLEAMACGVPPVGFNHGVNAEIIVHGETGWLVEPGDFESLREGVYYCLENRRRLGENARQAVIDNFQWKDRIQDYLPFYLQGLNGQELSGPKVSVIVTAYNLENYLPACIESVLNQEEFDDYELIIVDDNSPDRCGEIADGYAKRYPQCKVLHNTENVYLAEARNSGIASARGEYILPLDADDEIGRHTLRVLSESLDKNPTIDIATGKFELIEADGRHWVSTWPPLNPNYNDQINHRNQVPYCSMYRKRWWKRVGGYRRRWKSAEDAENWTRLMSYGAVPAHVTDRPTLIYNNRPNSMSHSIAEPDWTAWFPWSRYPQFTPFGASGTPDNNLIVRPVLDYDPIKVSVIIPVGPGHLPYLQDAIDSVVAQTFQHWECVVINDTGQRWFNEQGNHLTHYTLGFPYVTWVDGDKCEGVAAARNKGVAASRAPYIQFLDADDYLQPLTLDIFYKTLKRNPNSFVYGNWTDQDGEVKEALEYDPQKLLTKMPCSIVIMLNKEAFIQAGGFDEDAPGWEDFSLLLSLLEIRVQGIRVPYSSFTYRYHAGARREENYSRETELLKWIRQKHRKLYNISQSV